MEADTITLRDLAPADLDSLVRWRNDPEVNRYLSDRLKTRAEADAWYQRLRSNSKVWLKAVLESDQLVGYAVVESIDEKNRKCELALVIGETPHWGKGIGTHLIGEMLYYAFDTLRMHRVWAVVSRGNYRSEALVKKAGFINEGTMREAVMIGDAYTDLLCYSQLEEEYRTRRR